MLISGLKQGKLQKLRMESFEYNEMDMSQHSQSSCKQTLKSPKTPPTDGRIPSGTTLRFARWTMARVSVFGFTWENASRASLAAMHINVLLWKQMAKLAVAFTQRRDMRRHPTDRLSQQLITTRTVTQIHRSSLQNSQPLLCQQSPCPCMSQAPRLNGYPHRRVQADFSWHFLGATVPVSTALKQIQGDRIQHIDLIQGQDILADDLFESLLLLASSGRIGAALAAPYCSKHSWATLRSLGPAPDRTPEHLEGLPPNTFQQQLSVQESATIHDRSRILLSPVDQQEGIVILEKPSTSMTWDDPHMYQWDKSIAPFAAQACACMLDRDWAKA